MFAHHNSHGYHPSPLQPLFTNSEYGVGNISNSYPHSFPQQSLQTLTNQTHTTLFNHTSQQLDHYQQQQASSQAETNNPETDKKHYISAGTVPYDLSNGFTYNGGNTSFQILVIPKGTLLFSGYKQRNDDTKKALNDFMNIYLRGTRGIQKDKDQMCSSAPLNSYWNEIFFHPCPFFANGVAGYDFNAQGVWAVKSDIKLAILFGNLMDPAVNGLERSNFRNAWGKEINDFVVNSCNNFIDSNGNSYPWKKPSWENGTNDFDPCLYPPWMYDNEINGFITVAGADSLVIQRNNGHIDQKAGMRNIRTSNLHAWGTESNNNERFIKYLNQFTAVIKKSDSGPNNKYMYGIPEIVLFCGSYKFIKSVNHSSPVPRFRIITKYNPQTNRNVTVWQDMNQLMSISESEKLNQSDPLSKFLSTNSDGYPGRCGGDGGISVSQTSQFKKKYTKNNFLPQSKFRLFNDMQAIYPLFSGISNQPTNEGINDEVNAILNKIFYAMRNTGNIKFDNRTGFFIDVDIFKATDSNNYQPIKKGQYSNTIIKDKKKYMKEWISSNMTLKSVKGKNSPATFWLNSIVNKNDNRIIQFKNWVNRNLHPDYVNLHQVEWSKEPNFLNSLEKQLVNMKPYEKLIKNNTTIFITNSTPPSLYKTTKIGSGFFEEINNCLIVEGKYGLKKTSLDYTTNNLQIFRHRKKILLTLFISIHSYLLWGGYTGAAYHKMGSLFIWAMSYITSTSASIFSSILSIVFKSLIAIITTSPPVGFIAVGLSCLAIYQNIEKIKKFVTKGVSNSVQILSNVSSGLGNVVNNCIYNLTGYSLLGGVKRKSMKRRNVKKKMKNRILSKVNLKSMNKKIRKSESKMKLSKKLRYGKKYSLKRGAGDLRTPEYLNNTSTVIVKDTDTIENVKAKLEEREEIGAEQERVIFNQENSGSEQLNFNNYVVINYGENNKFANDIILNYIHDNDGSDLGNFTTDSENNDSLSIEEIPGIKKISSNEYQYDTDELSINVKQFENSFELTALYQDVAVDKILKNTIDKYLGLLEKCGESDEELHNIFKQEEAIEYLKNMDIQFYTEDTFKQSISNFDVNDFVELDTKLIGNSIDVESGIEPLVSDNQEKLLADKVGNQLITEYLNNVQNYRDNLIPPDYNTGVSTCNDWGGNPQCLQDSNCFLGLDRIGNKIIGECSHNDKNIGECYYETYEEPPPAEKEKQIKELYTRDYFVREMRMNNM